MRIQFCLSSHPTCAFREFGSEWKDGANAECATRTKFRWTAVTWRPMLGHAQETPGFVGSGDFALDGAVGRPGLLPSPQDTFFHQIQRLRALGYLVEERAAEPCRKSVARAGRKKQAG